MIIYKDKGFETRSDMPNGDWTGEASYIVPDGSELANKIVAFYPYYDFVLDSNGQLIDVVETERPEEPEVPEEPTDQGGDYVTWDELATAYTEGVNSIG